MCVDRYAVASCATQLSANAGTHLTPPFQLGHELRVASDRSLDRAPMLGPQATRGGLRQPVYGLQRSPEGAQLKQRLKVAQGGQRGRGRERGDRSGEGVGAGHAIRSAGVVPTRSRGMTRAGVPDMNRTVSFDTLSATLTPDHRVVVSLRGVYAGQLVWDPQDLRLAGGTIVLPADDHERLEDAIREVTQLSEASLIDPATRPEYHGFELDASEEPPLTEGQRAAVVRAAHEDAAAFVEEFGEALDPAATDWDAEAFATSRGSAPLYDVLPEELWDAAWPIYQAALVAETERLARLSPQ